MTENIFAAVLGSESIKWDAFFHLFEWLLDDEEGHGLGTGVRSRLVKFAFGETTLTCRVKREHPVSGQTDGRGKWVDLALGLPNLVSPELLIVMDDVGYKKSGDRRKLENLVAYIDHSNKWKPEALVRAVVITDAPKGTSLAKIVANTLGEEAEDYSSARGWKLLRLSTIGDWVSEAMTERRLNPKVRLYLEDFVHWSTNLHQ